MESDASSVLNIFLNTKELWSSRPFSSVNSTSINNDQIRQKMPLLSVLFDALSALDFSDVVNLIRESKKNSDFGEFSKRYSNEKWTSLNFHNPKLLYDSSLDAVVRCASSSTTEQDEFRKILEKGNGLVKANSDADILSSPNLIALFYEIDSVCGGAPPISLTSGAIKDESGVFEKYKFDPIAMKLTTTIQLLQTSTANANELPCEYVTSTKSTLYCSRSPTERSLLFSVNGTALILETGESISALYYRYRTFLND
jgi:hypothetical protein